MIPLLSAFPVLSTILALIVGLRPLYAAFLGVMTALITNMMFFPHGMTGFIPALLSWLPVLTEVLLIIAGGLLLSHVLNHSGAQAALAEWISRRTGQGTKAVLLVVHGITPFAESLTGFGIGITIGIPLLAHFGLPPRKVAIIGLLGLCAVPWGSMAPGTLIAAQMAGLSFHDLGVASAIFSIIPFTVTGIVAAWLAAPQNRKTALMQGIGSGLIFALAVTLMNMAFGTPPAGALGALIMILLHLLPNRRLTAPALPPIGRRALACYGLLLGGVLITGLIIRSAPLPDYGRYGASPALWLFIAILWFSRGLPPKTARATAWTSWCQVAPVTGMFILLGVLMAVSGMAANLAHGLAQMGQSYAIIAPFIGAMGGFITGSNSGANAMLAAPQAEIARALQLDVLWFMAAHNVAAAFSMMASPGKIELALQLCQTDATRQQPLVQKTMLLIALATVGLLALALSVLIVSF